MILYSIYYTRNAISLSGDQGKVPSEHHSKCYHFLMRSTAAAGKSDSKTLSGQLRPGQKVIA
jgi:hypothetical protein